MGVLELAYRLIDDAKYGDQRREQEALQLQAGRLSQLSRDAGGVRTRAGREILEVATQTVTPEGYAALQEQAKLQGVSVDDLFTDILINDAHKANEQNYQWNTGREQRHNDDMTLKRNADRRAEESHQQNYEWKDKQHERYDEDMQLRHNADRRAEQNNERQQALTESQIRENNAQESYYNAKTQTELGGTSGTEGSDPVSILMQRSNAALLDENLLSRLKELPQDTHRSFLDDTVSKEDVSQSLREAAIMLQQEQGIPYNQAYRQVYASYARLAAKDAKKAWRVLPDGSPVAFGQDEADATRALLADRAIDTAQRMLSDNYDSAPTMQPNGPQNLREAKMRDYLRSLGGGSGSPMFDTGMLDNMTGDDVVALASHISQQPSEERNVQAEVAKSLLQRKAPMALIMKVLKTRDSAARNQLIKQFLNDQKKAEVTQQALTDMQQMGRDIDGQ